MTKIVPNHLNFKVPDWYWKYYRIQLRTKNRRIKRKNYKKQEIATLNRQFNYNFSKYSLRVICSFSGSYANNPLIDFTDINTIKHCLTKTIEQFRN